MRTRLWQVTRLATGLLMVAACNFKPSTAGQTGAGGSVSATGAGGAVQSGSGGAPVSGTGGSPGTGGSVVPGTGGTSSGDIGVTGSGGQSCGQTNISIKPVPPDILIVQDKSLSMEQNASGQNCNTAGCSKWEQVSAAIDSVVQATDTNVNWGLVFFGTDGACGVSSTPVVPVGPMSGSNIQAAFAGNMPTSYTPTAAAVNAAVTYMKSLTDTNQKFLLLATDGLPNCGPTTGAGGAGGAMMGRGGGMFGGGANTADDSPNAEAAVTAAKTAGFPTFVVGIATNGDAMATDTLNTMAVNGGFPQTGAATQYYSVTDTASLENALDLIVGKTLSCAIPLGNKPANLSNVAVSAQDKTGHRIEIPKDDTNGWSFDATMTNIVLNGSACTDLQSVTLTAYQFIFACADVKICIDNCPGVSGGGGSGG
jgi:hypothetical protein